MAERFDIFNAHPRWEVVMVRVLNDEELRSSPASVLEALDAGDDVTIVADGEPRALVLRVSDGDADALMDAVRTHRMRHATARMRAAAAAHGLDQMSDDEINAEIAAARAERRARD